MEDHDFQHEDPQDFWDECTICAERIEGDIETGKRTPDGELKEESNESV